MREKQVQVGAEYSNGARHTATIKLVSVIDGITYVTYVQTFTDDSGKKYRTMQSMSKMSFLGAFKYSDPLIKGAVYEHGGITYYVQEVFTISNPVSDRYRKMARVVAIDQRGKRWMDMVTIGYLSGMRRVK